MVILFTFSSHSNRNCRRSNGLNSFESDRFCARSRMVVDHKHIIFLSPPRSWQHSAERASILSGLQGERARGPRCGRGPLTRRFIVTEGIFEKDGAMVDLPKFVSYALSMAVRLRPDQLLSQIDRAEAQAQVSPHP